MPFDLTDALLRRGANDLTIAADAGNRDAGG
jgi:hypothetical protein